MKQNIRVGLDKADPRVQVMRVGDLPEIRLGSRQARQLAAMLLHNAEQQERHAQGARIVLPNKVERLA